MKKITTHSKLQALMEMIFVLLSGADLRCLRKTVAASYMAGTCRGLSSRSLSPVPVKFWKELTALFKIFWH